MSVSRSSPSSAPVRRPIESTLRSLGLLLLLVLGVLGLKQLGWLQAVDTGLGDLRFQVHQRPASGDVVLVDIDAKSLAEIGVWPWPRHLHGDLVRAAARAGVARLAFDVDFSTVSQTSEDEAFAEALGTSKVDSFLAAFVQPDTAASDKLRASLPIEPLLQSSWPVSVNVPIDADGRVRRFPRSTWAGDEKIASMPSTLADNADREGEFGIDHAIAVATLPRVSYVDLLRGRVDAQALSGKNLIVGASAIELRDLFFIPVSGVVSGSTVIALAAETLLQNRALAPWSPPLILVAAMMALGALLVWRFPMKRSLLILATIAASVEILAVWLYIDRAVGMRTAELHFVLFACAAWSVLREFSLRQLRLWAARIRARNTFSLLERVVDDGFDAVVIVDDAGMIQRFNNEARLLLDFPEEGGPIDLSILPPSIRQSVRDGMTGLATGQEQPGRLRTVDTIRIGSSDKIIEYSVASFWMQEERQRRRPSSDGERRYACVLLRDVTERERAQERLRFAALHDSLTGLSNRRALEAELDALCAFDAAVDESALLAFDLDRFKGVNDALGHATGDAVLVETARRAADLLPEGASLFRIGGDEFVILLKRTSLELARHLADDLVHHFDQPFVVHGHRISVGTSVGIAIGTGNGRDAPTLRRHADVALYRAKRTAAQRIVVFEPGMEAVRLERLALEKDLKQAIENDEFEVVYQPQIRLQDRTWTGAEALVRWRHPERGYVSPAQFIPVAEEMGLIHELGARVLAIACRDADTWPIPIKIAVNVSPLQFAAGDVAGAVRHALATSGLDPKRLELEITESAFVEDNLNLATLFEDLLALGITFALDDFGTGYSSLGYLHRFPISKIKIDRSFVIDLPDSRQSMAVLRSVMALADGLDIRTIAEGIETEDQALLLRNLGCQDGQGYLFSKPISSAAVTQLLLTQPASLLSGPKTVRLAAFG